MNRQQLDGRWTQLRGKIKEKWGKLTDDQLDQLDGQWDQLVGLIQQQYGDAREEVERQVYEFRRTQERMREQQAGR